MAKIIDGKAISALIREEIAEKVKEYNAKTGNLPGTSDGNRVPF